MAETRQMSSKMCSKDGRIEAAPGSASTLNPEPNHIYLEGGKVADISVSNQSSISESRKGIAGEFLTLAKLTYDKHHAGLARSIRLAVQYGWSLGEIAGLLGWDVEEVTQIGVMR